MTKYRRVFTNSNSIAGKIVVRNKQATGFIEDALHQNEVQPSLVKLSDNDAWRFFEGNDWIFSTVNRIVNDCVKVPLEIVAKDPSQKEKVSVRRHITTVKRFIEDPNGNKESFMNIREKTIRNILVYGRAAIEKVNSSEGRRLKEVYSQSPKNIKINADKHGNLQPTKTYALKHPHEQETKYFDLDELIFMVLTPTTNSMYGVKILDAIANTVAADILRATYNSRFFINGAEASGILGLEGMDKRTLTKFKEEWKKRFQGAKNAHKTGIVNVPIKYIRMAITNRDLEFSDYGKELRTKIFAAYGMQPFVMGIVDENTGKLNSEKQYQVYKDGALRPILSREAFYYTQEIIKMGFGYGDIEVKFKALDYQDEETQNKMEREDIKEGIITINEARSRRGLPPVKWGDTPVSLAPGGGQVDPNTGNIVSPSNQDNNQNNGKKPEPKKYLKSVKEKIEPFVQFCVDKDFNLKLKINKKDRQVFVNGKRYNLSFYTLPVELKKQIEYKVLDLLLDHTKMNQLDSLDIRNNFYDSIKSELMFVVFDCILNKNLFKLNEMIDSIMHSVEQTEFYKDIF